MSGGLRRTPTDRSNPPPSSGRQLTVVWVPVMVLVPAGLANVVLPGTTGPDSPAFAFVLFAGITTAYAGVGAFVITRAPQNAVGWLLWLIGLLIGLNTAATAYGAWSLAGFGGGLPGTVLAGWITQWAFSPPLVIALLLLPLLFPDGRPPTPRWRLLVAFSALVVVVSALPDMLAPGNLGPTSIANPTGWPGDPTVLDTAARLGLGLGIAMLVGSLLMPVISVSLPGSSSSVGVRNPIAVLPSLPIWSVLTPDTTILPIVALLLGSVGSLFVRYRRATGQERQQLRWIAAALALVIIGVLAGFAASAVIPGASGSGLVWLGPIVAVPLVPVAIGFAVLRYRLYDIDRIISRTISWTLTSGLVVGLFAGLIVALQALLAPITAQSGLAVAGSTLITAAAFQPVRRRIQAVVDRRFNRRRYDTERIVAAYAAHLRGVADLGEIEAGAVDAVARSVRPRGAAMWIRPSRGGMP